VTVAVTPNLARSNVLVVTGTDTGVGKTWVAMALAARLARAGRRVIALKLVETGCGGVAEGEEDGALLAASTGQAAPRRALLRFDAPLAPAAAAELAGVAIDFDDVLLQVEAFAAAAELIVVEGAGGLLTPIGWDWNLVDLAQALEARALLVAPDRLGVINHTLLTLSALEVGGVPVVGLVLNAPATPDASTGTNAAAIRRLSGLSQIGLMPRVARPGDAALDEVAGWL
jgi:dethiobiotin synthetase